MMLLLDASEQFGVFYERVVVVVALEQVEGCRE